MATYNRFRFDLVIQKLSAAKIDLPVKLQNEAQKHFIDNFNTEEFNGKKWDEVQRRIPGTNAYKYPLKKDLARHTRQILRGKTRNLFESVAKRGKREATWERIRLASDVEYAQYHNDGTGKLPKRTFMAQDEKLNTKVHSEIKKQLDKVLKTFK